MMFSPSQLFHAQDSIKHRFQDGRTLDQSLVDLLRYDSPECRLPPMDVMYVDGRPYVVDGNRRLYLLKQLESAGLVTTVSVYITSLDPYSFRRKFSTECKGVSILIRNDSSMESKIKNIIEEHMSGRTREQYREQSRQPRTPARHADTATDEYWTSLLNRMRSLNVASRESSQRSTGYPPAFKPKPKVSIVSRHKRNDFGIVLYRWVITGISMSPKEAVEKICDDCNTSRSTRRRVVEKLAAVYSVYSQPITTKLNLRFRQDESNSELCEIYLEELDGTYTNMKAAVVGVRTLFTES